MVPSCTVVLPEWPLNTMANLIAKSYPQIQQAAATSATTATTTHETLAANAETAFEPDALAWTLHSIFCQVLGPDGSDAGAGKGAASGEARARSVSLLPWSRTIFSMNGNSLTAIMLLHRVRAVVQQLQPSVNIFIHDIFNNSSVYALRRDAQYRARLSTFQLHWSAMIRSDQSIIYRHSNHQY